MLLKHCDMSKSMKGKATLIYSAIWALLLTIHSVGNTRELTLSDAIDHAVNHTSRGATIKGDVEVAERNYFAKRINFYVPEVSLNASAPAYSSNQSYDFYYGFDNKILSKKTDFDLSSNIQLKQSLITGGTLTARANLLRNVERYPRAFVPVGDTLSRIFIADDLTRQGFFDFAIEQPLLKPSEPKHELGTKRDEYHIAELAAKEQTAALKKEVIDAYFGVLLAALNRETTEDKSIAAKDQSRIDSLKMVDGVVPQETSLESSAKRLDAELEFTDAENKTGQTRRDLATLLELPDANDISLHIPDAPPNLTTEQRTAILTNWEQAVPVLKAQAEYEKARRSAKYAASGHGISGNLAASYAIGRGRVSQRVVAEGALPPDEDINTSNWQIGLNLSIPIWDGGASAAEVKAAELSSEKSRIELERAKKTAQTDLTNLLSRLDVSFKKLDVLRQKIDITKAKLDIAEFRFKDGQVSVVQYHTSRVDYHTARQSYLEELQKYLLDRADLESKYTI
jgi:outer membrane protein TolC